MIDITDLKYDSNWESAFACAGLEFDQVASIESARPGENDGPKWLTMGTLKNGDWFVLRAWCDYTGWGCQDGGSYETANTRDELIMMKMDFDERTALLDK